MSRGRLVSAAVVAALVLLTATERAAGVQQAPPRDMRPSAPPPMGTAVIGGIVVAAEGARPLRMAHVVIIGSATGTLRVTSTDADGRFVFADLPADRYIIGASKQPYLGAVAGARRPARPGTAVAVADGEKISNVAIRLPLGASISGTITDERGKPGTGVLLGLQRTQGAERVNVTTPGGLVGTDERGRYRLYGLPPGEYFVTAMRVSGGEFNAVPLSDADVDAALKGAHVSTPAFEPPSRYAPVFFPGTMRASDAAPIVVSAGDERDGVDFRLELGKIVRLEGMVLTSEGQPAAAADVSVRASTASPMQVNTRARTSPDGRFSVTNLPPGSYTIIAQATGAPGSVSQSAAITVEVEGADQTGLQLTLKPPLSFSARLAFDGATPPPLVGRRIPIKNVTPGAPSGAGPQTAPTNADGMFQITNVSPGRLLLGGPLFFGATTDSVTWSLQSVVVDGRDVTDLPFDITSDTAPKSVVVTYGDRWQQLSGRLSQSSGTAASEYTIVVFPANRAYWMIGSRRILTTRPGTDGRFTIAGPGPLTLPPGDYLVAAVTDIDRDEQYDPAFLASVVSSAVPFTLHAGEKKVQDLMIK